MKIWIVVKHYDIGSDEFAIEAVYDSPEKALNHIREKYPNWMPYTYDGENPADFEPHELQYFQDLNDQQLSDRVYIEVEEVK